MYRYIVTILLFVFSFQLFAGNVSGKIVDEVTQKPLEFVTVAVFNPATQKNQAGVLSKEDGSFFLASVPVGTYELRASFVGYETAVKEIKVEESHLRVGMIALNETGAELKAIEVVGQGSQMRFDIDKRVFSVDQNIAAAGGTATDILENIPSVDVDGEGNVSLRNSSSVEIWINGKPSGINADNQAQILEQMPAESLESIEIMTNPSAKYNPEGTAGIINLVMKKDRRGGYYGSVSAGGVYNSGKFGPSAGVSINYNGGKFDAFANIGFRNMKRIGSGLVDRTNYLQNGDTTLLLQRSSNDGDMRGLFMRAGVDYHVNSKNTVGISGMAHLGSPQQSSNTSYLLKDNHDNILRNYSRDNEGSHAFRGINLNLSHKMDFDKKGSNLMTNVIFSNNRNLGEQRFVQTDSLTSAVDLDNTQKTMGGGPGLEVKTDYTKKFTDKDRMELGWSSRMSDRLSEASGYDHLTEKEIEAYYNQFDQKTQIHAAYGTYGTRINNLSLQGGLRGEYYRSESTTTPADTPQPLVNTYFQLFPSLFLSYLLPKNNELQVNYTRRINRPWGRQINSFRDYSDSTNISYGNPMLTPEFASVMELNYMKTWDNHMLSSSIYYRFTDDLIQRVSFMRNDVMESTYMNLSQKQDLGFELVAKNRLLKILNLTSSLNAYRSSIDSATYIHPLDNGVKIGIPPRSSFSWDARVIGNVMLSPTFSGQLTGNYRSAEITAQGERLASYSMDMGLRKTFFERKLSLNLNVRDVFLSRIFRNTSFGEGFEQYSENRRGGRSIRLTATWTFGNMRPKPSEMRRQSDGMESENEMEMGM